MAEFLRLSKKKFINTPEDPYTTAPSSKGYPGSHEAPPDTIVTVGVFFDAQYTPSLPFWIAFNKRNPVGLALDKCCKAASVPNNGVFTKPGMGGEAHMWHAVSLTPHPSKPAAALGVPLDMNAAIEDVAVDGDVWFVGKGPIMPPGLLEEAAIRVNKISSRRAFIASRQPAATPQQHPQHQQQQRPAPHTGPANGHSPSAAAPPRPHPAAAAAPASSASAEPLTVIELRCAFIEMNKTISIRVSQDCLVSDLLATLRTAAPEATKDGVRIMFYEKYVKNEKDCIRSVPLVDNSAIDVITGKYLSENEATLFLANRKLQEVRSVAAAHQGPMTDNLRKYLGEQLMKALMLLDGLQDVPEDIRMRRKAAVKEVIAEQDTILEMK